MYFSYKPLWKKLIDCELTKKSFREKAGISKSTIDKMVRNENVSLEIIARICQFFDCPIQDVILFVNEEKK